jgi:hypothetical protein
MRKGGSGRNNKGVQGRYMEGRPDCHICTAPMKSDGKKDWKCVECGVYRRKNPVFRHTPESREENRWGYDTEKAEAIAQRISEAHKPGSTYVITSAQNNTDVHSAYFKSLLKYCEYNDATLVVIASHYENVTAVKKDKGKKWVKEIEPYLIHGELRLGHLSIQSHIKINATAVKPLSGMESIGGDTWTVFGHPRQHLLSVATPADLLPKMMYTTGSITKKNYSISKAGAKGEFNHVTGALVVEFNEEGSMFPFIRQINANGNGHFYDLDKRYTPKKVTTDHSILALATGDEHQIFNTVEDVTYMAPDSIVKTLKPKYLIRHDVLDGYAGSHHHERDPLLQFKKHHNGMNDYRKELDSCVKFINRTTPEGAMNLIVPSNHHDHLKKWLDRAETNKDHTNALLIAELQLEMRKAVLVGKDPDPFKLYCENKLTCKTKFLSRNEQYLIKNIDVSQHGDVGVNGSRGSINNLAKGTFKSIIGHSHSAGIIDGCFQVGKSTDRMGYESGLSSHSKTHAIIYPDGKRTLLTIINNKWRK